jgi:hypothetical protein
MSTSEFFVPQISEALLSKTCKALQRGTRQRAVWVAALHQVCLDNALFLPTFPISDMSDLELEKSAMAPTRWIDVCRAFEEHHNNDTGTILHPKAIRIIKDLEIYYRNTEIFIVPGGRYLLSYLRRGDSIFLLDLGYNSSADCKLIASVKVEGGCDIYRAQATPDGMGLTIFSSNA